MGGALSKAKTTMNEKSVLISFFLIETIGTTFLTAVVALSTYQGWRALGVIFFGLVYYGLLRGMKKFGLRYRSRGEIYEEGKESEKITMSPRFNPVLVMAHFIITGNGLAQYNGNYLKPIAIVIGCTISNVIGAMIGGAAFLTVIKKPGGTALDDVYKFGTSYLTHNMSAVGGHSGNITTPLSQTSAEYLFQGVYSMIQKATIVARDSSYESPDHLYTEGVAMELIGIFVLAYAFTVDDTKGSNAVSVERHADSLGKPAAVSISALLLAYTFADYTGGVFNPAIAFGIYMDHDLSRFWPHLWSSFVALVLLLFGVLIFVTAPKAGMSANKKSSAKWYYDHFGFQFTGLFLLTLLVLQSVGDLGISTLRPERWTTVGPIFYGLAIGSMVWVARHMGYRRDYFHPLANAACGLFSILDYTESDPIGYGQFAFVLVRDALAVAAANGFFYYVSPLRNGKPHLSHFVALGFSTYDTTTFTTMISQPIMDETEALQAAAKKGTSWAFSVGPEVLGTLIILGVVMAGSMNESSKINAIRFGSISGLLVYLFGSINSGLYNPWLSLFSLQYSGNFSEFNSDRVGRIHAFGPIVLVLVAGILKLDDKYNNREDSMGNTIKALSEIDSKTSAAKYTAMESDNAESTVFTVTTGSSASNWDM